MREAGIENGYLRESKEGHKDYNVGEFGNFVNSNINDFSLKAEVEQEILK